MWHLLAIFVLTCGCGTSHELSSSHHHTIDLLLHKLGEEPWEPEEIPCLKKTVLLLENAKNSTLWAAWVLNANAIPSGNLYGSWWHMGNYDQCLNPPWLHTHPEFRTQHCLADLTLDTKDKMRRMKVDDHVDPYQNMGDFLNQYTITGIPMNRMQWGVCMPATCHPQSIAKITRFLYDMISFGNTSPNVTVENCQIAGVKQQYTNGFYMFMLLITTLVIVTVGSTYYRKCYASDTQPPDSLESIITKSFDIVMNHQDLMTMNKEEIKVMNGMRFITAASMVLIHEYLFSFMTGVQNVRDHEKNLSGFNGNFLHADVMVDTFLLMSGLLYIRGLLANVNRQSNLFMVLLKRYLRLIGPFAMCIFFIACIARHSGSGPIWDKNVQAEVDLCQLYWKRSLLMMNTNIETLCHFVTWYLACDYQLAILGTILFFFYQKNRKLGFYAFGVASVLSIAIPAGLTYWYRLPAIHFLNKSIIIYHIREYWQTDLTYSSSYSRAGAYIVGLAMGYIMYTYKPAEHRNVISKKWSIIITAVSFTVMMLVMISGKVYMFKEYDPIEAAVVASTNRVVWAIGVCCIIGCCEYGNVPLVSSFLSWSLFTPLSRLSYGLYIIHPIFIARSKFVTRNPVLFDNTLMIKDIVSTLVISIGISYLMWLLVEAPMMKLSNYLLVNKSNSSATTMMMKKPESSGLQNGAQNGIQNGAQNGIQNGAQNGIQNSTQNGIQNGAQKRVQNGAHNGIQNDAQNGIQNSTQNGIQNGAQNGIQNSTQNGIQNGAQNGLQNGAMNGVKNGVQNGHTKLKDL